jgi:arylformamidase
MAQTAAMRPLAGFRSQAEIDQQYDTSYSVADEAACLRHYLQQARRARESLRCIPGVPYGPTLAERLDIFPAAQPNAPVFVFIHGGYWRALAARDFSGVALGLHARGITTVVIDYALCPHVSLDEITRQARAAVAWVVRDIAAHGGDPSRVAVGGHSAGGQLAAMCLQTEWARDYGLAQDPLRAAVLVSGLYELEPLRWSYLQPTLQLDEGLVWRNSPVLHVRPCATPAWITWGSAETAEFSRQAGLYGQAWHAAGNAAEVSPQPGADHFSAIHGFEDPDSALCAWLADRLFPS